MLIVSQDKKMIMNLKNIESIAIGNPLNNNLGKFPILTETTSDNEYVIAEYKTEERAKEVLEDIANAYSDFSYYRNAKDKEKQKEIGMELYMKYRNFEIYKMPEE